MRILIAEDEPVSRRLIAKTVAKWGYDVVTAADGNEAMEELAVSNGVRLAILDWMMPGLSGAEICSKIRELKEGDYYYLMLLSARKDNSDIVAGLKAGADDYITKPVNSGELRMRIRCGERVLRLEQQLLEVQERLRREAAHDALTGLMNKGALIETLEREEARLERCPEENLAVVMLDLDFFKAVNDTYGHAAGDVVLKEAASRMAKSARGYDVVGRYGGEEFLIILPNCSLEDAAVQAERLRQLIGNVPIDIDDGPITVTASIGVAASDISGVETTYELINQADKALYAAKKNGRNRVEVADVIIRDCLPAEEE